MKTVLSLCALTMLGWVACGSSGSVSTSSDSVAMRSAPAGMATLAFLDLEASLRPDALTGAITPSATLPTGVTASPSGATTTFTFANSPAASTGALNGTIAVTVAAGSGSTVFTEVFNLTDALDGTRSWHYTGTQTVTLTGSSATVAVLPATAIHVAFTDTGTPSNNKSFVFSPALAMTWDGTGRFTLDGSYGFAGPGPETITASIAPSAPMMWTASCGYPVSGTLNLVLSTPAVPSDATTAAFGPVCGQMTLGGGTITLGKS
jgi:hypothetical protein